MDGCCVLYDGFTAGRNIGRWWTLRWRKFRFFHQRAVGVVRLAALLAVCRTVCRTNCVPHYVRPLGENKCAAFFWGGSLFSRT